MLNRLLALDDRMVRDTQNIILSAHMMCVISVHVHDRFTIILIRKIASCSVLITSICLPNFIIFCVIPLYILNIYIAYSRVLVINNDTFRFLIMLCVINPNIDFISDCRGDLYMYK